ncbi:MAG: M28 family peptidase [Candidatus Latescibacteria bacterium]|nr:M28 family peptidase [Candidatus Latescibacterota bacterium]
MWSKIKTGIGLLVAALMLSSVTIFHPKWITDHILMKLITLPEPVGPSTLVAVSNDQPLNDALNAVNEESIRSTIGTLSSFGSRVVGYRGADRASEYVRAQFEQIGLQDVRTDTFTVTVPIDKGAVLIIRDSGLGVRGSGTDRPDSTLDLGVPVPDSVLDASETQLQVSGSPDSSFVLRPSSFVLSSPQPRLLRLYSLWPNHVRTSTTPRAGLTGPLLYARKGDFRDFNGNEVKGSIVLMDFDSGENYINARMLGAQAVIFFDNGLVTRGDAERKFMGLPVNIPRYWVERGDADRLIALSESGTARVTVRARMDWERVQAKNVYGVLPGLDEEMPGARGDKRKWKDHTIVVESFYDAMSVVPRLAPGAESATGIAALFEVAKAVKAYRPKYTVLFLATSAHFLGMEGINNFLYRHGRASDYFMQRIPEPDKIDFDVFFGLDLSSHDSRVGSFCFGTFYNPAWATNHYIKNIFAPYSKKFASYIQEGFGAGADSLRYVNAIIPPQRTWKDFMPVPIGLDNEAVTFFGKKGMSFVTPNGSRERVDTPVDRFEQVNLPNVVEQAKSLAVIIARASSDAGLFEETKLRIQDTAHDLSGTVVEFDRDINFFVPKKFIPGALVTYFHTLSHSGVRGIMVTKADSVGQFSFKPLRETGSIRLHSYKLNEDGEIVYGPDYGTEGDGTYPLSAASGGWENSTLQIVFPCRSLDIYEIIDSRYLTALDNLTILGPDDAAPQWYGYSYVPNQSGWERRTVLAAVVLAKPGQRLKLLMGTSLFGIKYLLTNAPDSLLLTPVQPNDVTLSLLEKAQGQGYLVDDGLIVHPSYRGAKDMWIIDDVRLKQLARFGVENQRITKLHEEARLSLIEANQHLEAKRYDAFISAARRAWGLEARGYPDVKATADDTVKGVIFYFVLLLPFSFFMERLLFGFPTINKRIAAFAGIFVLVFLILQQVHPAFKLSTSPYVIFLAFVIMALGVIVLFIVLSKFNQEVQKMKRASTGMHEADIGRLSATAVAISLGISNLRKRKIRTGLTAVTITLLTFTVLSFTSISTSLKYYKLGRDNPALYEGTLVRDRNWKGLQPSIYDYLKSAFEQRATLIPRAWFMSQVKGEKGYFTFALPAAQKESYVNSLLGLSADEPKASKLDQFLLGGRWFNPGERAACILPDDIASVVGLTPQDAGNASIQMFGLTLKVVGIIDSKRFNQVKDLDDEKLTPVDLVQEKGKIDQRIGEDPRLQAESPPEAFIHLESNNVMILPFETVMELGGTMQSVAITDFRDEQGRPNEAFDVDIEDFLSRVALTMFVGKDGNVNVYSSIGSTSISGVQNFAIPILVAAMIVLNTMMGAVHERFREIGVYSSVGLAPSHIASLFLAESAVFATVGAVMGYLVGQILSLVLVSKGWLVGLSLNYSSLSAMWSTLVVMGTVFLSTAYPAKKAADMAVPDVGREWKFPEPDGDEWRFDFPFTIGSVEVLGMYAYLTRVFESYEEGSLGAFVTEDVTLTSQSQNGARQYQISMMTWLAPYDLGISQRVSLMAAPAEAERDLYAVKVDIHRESGDVASWQRINRRFLSVLRKRFLVWRTLPQDLKNEYAQTGRTALGIGG